MYNTDFIVKYKSIEEELLEKIEKGEVGYTKEDVYKICNDLYQHELLSVFQITNIEDSQLEKKIDDLWGKIKENSECMDVINRYREKLQIDDTIGDKTFVMLFNYDFFYLLHLYICKCLLVSKVNDYDEQLNTIYKKIGKI